MSKLDRFQKDVDALASEGGLLEIAFIKTIIGKDALIAKLGGGEKGLAKVEALPHFNTAYEAWYSEAIALIAQILPDRLADFREHFENSRSRKDITYANYTIKDALLDLKVTRAGGSIVVVDHNAALPHLRQQIAMVLAAKRRFSSTLFEIRQLLQADLLDSEIETARELHAKGFLRPAGTVAGVVLEKHLGQVCADHKIAIRKKNPGINDLNQLLRDDNVIDVPQWRNIGFLADIRNLCSHDKKIEPTSEQVQDLIDGTNKMLKTVA